MKNDHKVDRREISPLDRNSHIQFFNQRNWDAIQNFWGAMVVGKELPRFINGSKTFGITDLNAISRCGELEFSKTSDPRYKRKTFALRIGYNGSSYHGFQMQRGHDVYTVEEDIKRILGQSCVAAGRTDKGVSAVSQIISFHTFNDLSLEQVLNNFAESSAATSLTAYQCVRVPRRFHALFSASWRRYLYLLPMEHCPPEGSDLVTHHPPIDVEFVDSCFKPLVGKELSYNGFAFRDARDTGEGLSDICTMFVARAFEVELERGSREEEEVASGKEEATAKVVFTNQAPGERDNGKKCDSDNVSNGTSGDTGAGYAQKVAPSAKALCVELVGSRFLRRMVRILVVSAAARSLRVLRVVVMEDES